MAINYSKVAMIGCGFVGSASCFALMQSGLFREMVLIDTNKDKAEGEALDISHGLPSFGADMKVSLLNDGPFTVFLDSDELARKA